MKTFHVSDVLSVTTGRLVSSRHIEGVYDILNFMTGDNLFTHQLPRAARECESWLRTQFPALMKDSPGMAERLADLDVEIAAANGDKARIETIIQEWVEGIRRSLVLPEMVPVCELDAEMHTRIDPIEEAKAMVGDDRVITIRMDAAAASGGARDEGT